MKILNINTSIDPIRGGGTGERTWQMCRHLSRAGVSCTLLTLDLGLSPARLEPLEGVQVVALPCLNQRFYLPTVTHNTVLELVADADLVHIMGHWTIINVLAYWAAVRLKKPYVFCPAGALPIFGRSRLIKNVYNHLAGKGIVRGATRCVAISPDEFDHFAAYGADLTRVVLIPNGIDPSQYLDADVETFRSEHGIGNAPYLLFMGRLNSIKGPDIVIEAFSNLRDRLPLHHLVMAGPDEGLLEPMRKLTIDTGISQRVHFLGHVGGKDKSRALHGADLMVIPSRQEAMSIVVLEAGICSTPVLLTDRCGLNNLQELGCGVVVSPTVDGISEGLLSALGNTSNDLNIMGKLLRTHVEKNFLWDRIVWQYIDLFSDVLEGLPAD